MKIFFSTLLLTFLLAFTSAQLTTQGRWRPQGHTSPRVHRLPTLDNDVLASQHRLKKHSAYEFATPVEVTLTAEESGFWSILPNGDRLWSVTIESEGAFSLGVTLFKLYIPTDAELYLIGKDEIRGAFTSVNNPQTSNYFTAFPVKGSLLTIEYFQPAHVKETPSLNIIKVAHGYRPFGYGDSGRCNINVACDTGKWANQIRSSGMLLSGFGSRFCSGALVNNAANNGDQLFLTAAHCSVDSADIVMFNYQSATCTNADGPTSNTVGQLTRLANNANSDFTLVKIGESIPASWNVFLSGLSAVNVPPTSMVGIHHPSGDIKKISFADKAGVPGRWSVAEPGLWHWEVPSWDEGTTEPGSSGSPLYDQNQRVIGQLHGGGAACGNTQSDLYGGVFASWTLGLSTYIDPNGSGNLLVNGTDLNAVRRF